MGQAAPEPHQQPLHRHSLPPASLDTKAKRPSALQTPALHINPKKLAQPGMKPLLLLGTLLLSVPPHSPRPFQVHGHLCFRSPHRRSYHEPPQLSRWCRKPESSAGSCPGSRVVAPSPGCCHASSTRSSRFPVRPGGEPAQHGRPCLPHPGPALQEGTHR